MTTLIDTDSFTADKLLEAKANDYVRYIGALVETTRLDGGGIMAPHRAVKGFLEKWPRSLHLDLFTKAATNPGTTLEPAWGAPLAALRPLSEGFVSFTRGPSLEGQLFAAGARRVPFQTSVPVQTGAETYAWIGEGAATPVGNFQLASVTLPILKSAGIIPISEELARLAAPASVIALRTDLAAGLNAFLGSQMFDPTIAGVANVSPASLTNGSPSFGSAGSSAANALTDIKRLGTLFYAANPGAQATLIMSPAVLWAVSTALSSPTLMGSLFGARLIVDASVGGVLAAVDATKILIADDDGVSIDVSTQADLEFSTTPTSPSTAATIRVNLFALNLVAIRATRFLHYKLAHPSALIYSVVSYV